jgi:HD-GYP domain-containing protein (c-di-GMP phosphodiesterase class II)
VPGYTDMAEVVRSHHERWDGAGYPDNLVGEQIPRLARLIAVADSYNAMTSNRPYRGGMSPERAIEQLVLGKGSQYEAAPVDAFLRVLERAPGWYRRGQFTLDGGGLAAVETMDYPTVMTPRAAA